MHREKIRLAGHMRRIRVCDQCAMVSTDPTAMLLQEDLDTHMDVSRKLYAAMNETDQDIASFKALLKMVVPSADDQMAIDDLLSRIAGGVDDLVRESDAIEERLGSTGLATAELQSKLAQCESAMSSVVQRRHAIDAQVSMMPDIRAEGADLASQEELLTRKLHRLYARVEKLKPQAASVSLLPTKCDSLSDRPADESDPPCPSLLHLRDHRLPYLA
jgi:chromosome segregation ATPase